MDRFKDPFMLRYPSYNGQALDQFCAVLGRVGEERNDLIHAFWKLDPGRNDARRHEVVRDRGKILRLDTVTPQKVRRVAEKISRLDDRLWEMWGARS